MGEDNFYYFTCLNVIFRLVTVIFVCRIILIGRASEVDSGATQKHVSM